MEEFGDWLYVIIIIIAGISSLIGSINKKNKQAAEREQTREISTEEWEDWEEKETRYDDTEIPQTVPQPVFPDRQATFSQRHTVASRNLHTRQGAYVNYNPFDKKQDNSYHGIRKETDPVLPYTEDDSLPITVENLPADTDEWRKAFVYNEIFKRKY